MPLVQKYDLIQDNRVFETVTRQSLRDQLAIDMTMLDAEIDTMGFGIVDDDTIAVFHDHF